MVSAVSSNGFNQAARISNISREENVKRLVRYINNEHVSQTTDTLGSAVSSNVVTAGLFEGIPAIKLFFRNRKLVKAGNSTFKNGMKALGEANQAALKNITKGSGKLSERILNFVRVADQSNIKYREIKSGAKAATKALKLGQEVVQEGVKEGVEKGAEQVAKKGIFSKISHAFKRTKVGGYLSRTGMGIDIIFNGVMEAVTEVIPTFKELGKEKGMKQVGKSAVKAVGEAAGYFVGQKAGLSIGTAIGTAICPGIGTAIGAIVGFIGGCTGSWAAGKLAKKLVGKSERELAKEEKMQKESKEIAKNMQDTQALKASVLEKVQQELNTTGKLSEDSMAALKAVEALETSNPFVLA